MGFYDLSKEERVQKVADIQYHLRNDLKSGQTNYHIEYFSDEDTYIRKAAYTSIGHIYNSEANLRHKIISSLHQLEKEDDEHIRQTVVNAAGEIGKFQFETVQSFFDTALFDPHHKVRNAVIGSLKKMGQINPKPALAWASTYLTHADQEVRREICHGIELRGRTHPEDILPLLKVLEHDPTKRVSNTLVHVLGQIAYKKGCLPKVISHLKLWTNKELVAKALDEIIDVHSVKRYAKFTAMNQQAVVDYIAKELNE